ncbi:MAG TPA: hypothetical protein VGV37_16350 [Aliidongia sp.]|uniref:hypothetical protein n=1 Tax=Aliidongia sp. TaxID=1914230 RepID=UPI002DDD784E|nr:hypothetical protein [Aliidongia sp.]HEV2676096.1 hypothetical protein [Aliidongia sp.]
MRRISAGFLMVSTLLLTHHALARDTEYHPKIDEVMKNGDFYLRVGPGVAFFFATQNPPAIDQTYGEFVTNRKTDSFGRSDEDACRWAMLSALRELRDRANQLGGDAVVNIVSYYKKKVVASETDYECHAGEFVAGVALKGTVVKLKH